MFSSDNSVLISGVISVFNGVPNSVSNDDTNQHQDSVHVGLQDGIHVSCHVGLHGV